MTGAAATQPAGAEAGLLLSVIIPAWNVAPWIDRCLDSVLACLPDDAEAIVIDDGSSDDTAARVRARIAQAGGQRLHLLHSERGGPGGARNRGLEAAQGRFIWFVDADDEVYPEGARIVVERLRTTDCDLIEFDHRVTRPDGAQHWRGTARLPEWQVLTGAQALPHCLRGGDMYLWRRIFRRALIDRLPAPLFEPKVPLEDIKVIPALCASAQAVTYWPLLVYHYRMRAGSIVTSREGDWTLRLIRSLRRTRELIAGAGDPTEAVRAHDHFLARLVADALMDSLRGGGWGHLARQPLLAREARASAIQPWDAFVRQARDERSWQAALELRLLQWAPRSMYVLRALWRDLHRLLGWRWDD